MVSADLNIEEMHTQSRVSNRFIHIQCMVGFINTRVSRGAQKDKKKATKIKQNPTTLTRPLDVYK